MNLFWKGTTVQEISMPRLQRFEKGSKIGLKSDFPLTYPLNHVRNTRLAVYLNLYRTDIQDCLRVECLLGTSYRMKEETIWIKFQGTLQKTNEKIFPTCG